MSLPSVRDPQRNEIEARLTERLAEPNLEVPLLPEVAATVISDTDEEFDFRKVSEQIHRDQALAGHVLRVANSVANAGRAARIVSLQQALVRLGTRRVKELVLAVVMKTRIFRSNRHGARAQQIWRDAVSSACLARELARQLKRNPDSAFLCGLLHTVGKPVVLQIVSEFERHGRPLEADDLDRLLVHHHLRAGARLVSTWGLPDTVATTIEFLETPERAPAHRELVCIVAAAGIVGPRLVEDEPTESLARDPSVGRLQVGPDEMARALDRHRERVCQYVEAMG